MNGEPPTAGRTIGSGVRLLADPERGSALPEIIWLIVCQFVAIVGAFVLCTAYLGDPWIPVCSAGHWSRSRPHSTEPMLIAEAHHRDHAIVEQVIADLKRSALKHFPSGSFNANGGMVGVRGDGLQIIQSGRACWPAGNYARPAPAPSAPTLINIPGRLAFSAGSYTLHLPAHSRRERPFMTMFDNVQAPPQTA